MKSPLIVATYNVLAQCFVEPERYAYVSPPTLLHPAARETALLDTISRINASILLLQEVERGLLDGLLDRLGERYHVLFSPRPTHSDGCAILVSRADAVVLGQRTLVYRDREPGYSQVACIADLRCGDLELTVVSTHLRCGCQSTCGQPPLGQRQLAELLSSLQGRACILGGDLNALPDSPTLRLAYAAGLRRAGDAATAYIRGAREQRDYLLHTGVRLQALPAAGFEMLPSAQHPSDHVVVQAHLQA